MPLAIFLLGFLFLASCASDMAAVNAPEKTPEKPRIVGRIASIPADRKFVLIQSYGDWKIETGAVLTTQGPEGRAANLRATGEKLGQYAAADIQSGTLELGDGVYATPPTPDTVSTEVDEAETEATSPEKKADPAPID
ncbi:MAG: hypothetical protein H7Y36_08555 [Armatimonadetes bacterium]|nr:hypothetical protein [Akkermansiaceae bacterium]